MISIYSGHLASLDEYYDFVLRCAHDLWGLHRGDCIVGVGGGSVGDLGPTKTLSVMTIESA
ncbi:MAG: hypothetical protein NZL83_01790 [Candidatus Absconditabacterales bacterium]|nr:hypothetical protein [Candidatus Absconditabacterales bacterium]